MTSAYFRSRRLFIALILMLGSGCASTPPPQSPDTPAPAAASHAAPTPSAGTTTPPPGTLLDGIAAVVNDDVILNSELDARVGLVRHQLEARNTTAPSPDVLRKQVLDQMITTKLELQQADSHGISVSDDALNQALTHIAQRAGITLDQLPDNLKGEGIDYASFRQDIREQIVIHNLEQQVVNDEMHISPQEIQEQEQADQSNANAQTQYHISEILIATSLNPTPEEIAAAREKVVSLYHKLQEGADFAATAVAYSQDQQALKGGDLGWRSGSELPTIFSKVVQEMKPGDITQPISSPSGFHIVKLDDVKGSDHKVIVTQTHARHILIRPSAVMTSDQAEAKLEDIRKQILAGADFAKLAQQYSDDPGSAGDGGDLGWVDPGAMVPEFEAQMGKLKPGEISEPFKTQFGWHIVQVLDRRQQDQTDEYRRNKAYEAIYDRKSEEIIQHWLSELHDSAYIEYHPGD